MYNLLYTMVHLLHKFDFIMAISDTIRKLRISKNLTQQFYTQAKQISISSNLLRIAPLIQLF